jgi:hypothetical protein
VWESKLGTKSISPMHSRRCTHHFFQSVQTVQGDEIMVRTANVVEFCVHHSHDVRVRVCRAVRDSRRPGSLLQNRRGRPFVGHTGSKIRRDCAVRNALSRTYLIMVFRRLAPVSITSGLHVRTKPATIADYLAESPVNNRRLRRPTVQRCVRVSRTRDSE